MCNYDFTGAYLKESILFNNITLHTSLSASNFLGGQNLKKIFKYLSDYRKECFIGPLFKLLEASFELFVPLVVAEIIDQAIPSSNKTYLVKMCLLLVALGLIGLICAVAAQFFAAKAACGFAKKLKHSLFEHLQNLSYTELEDIGTSTMITRMTSDVNQLQTGVNLTIRLLLRSPFVVFGAMIMAFSINVKAALIFVVAIPLLGIVVFSIILGTAPIYKKVQAKLDLVLGKTRENLSGARVIRAFRLEISEREDFDQKNNDLAKLQKFVGRISALMNPLTYFILNLAIITLIYVGAIEVNVGIISQGAVFALYNYMSQILVELIKLANLIITLTKAIASGNRIASVFEISNSLQNGTEKFFDQTQHAVVFDHVSLKYKSAGDESVSDISFTVKHGQTVGIIGATGAGKSSLINLIARLYDATKGKVLIFGKDIRDYDIAALRNIVGIVPQKSVLFKGTVRENMQWRKSNATDDEIWKALELAQAAETVKSKNGLDTLVEQGGRNFSGGQKQRLAIARAFVGNPDIVILDDSSSALDYATEAAFRKALRNAAYPRTVFIVSQRASTLMHADQIIVIDDGSAVGIGKHEELIANCEVYKEICHSQLGGEVQ